MSLIILDQEYILGLENKGKWESEKTYNIYTVGLFFRLMEIPVILHVFTKSQLLLILFLSTN